MMQGETHGAVNGAVNGARMVQEWCRNGAGMVQ